MLREVGRQDAGHTLREYGHAPETKIELPVAKIRVGELGGREHDGLSARGLPAPRRLVRVARGLEQAVAMRRDQDEPVLLELLEALGARVLADVRLHLVERTLRPAQHGVHLRRFLVREVRRQDDRAARSDLVPVRERARRRRLDDRMGQGRRRGTRGAVAAAPGRLVVAEETAQEPVLGHPPGSEPARREAGHSGTLRGGEQSGLVERVGGVGTAGSHVREERPGLVR